jgi:hypothetical protein
VRARKRENHKFEGAAVNTTREGMRACTFKTQCCIDKTMTIQRISSIKTITKSFHFLSPLFAQSCFHSLRKFSGSPIGGLVVYLSHERGRKVLFHEQSLSKTTSALACYHRKKADKGHLIHALSLRYRRKSNEHEGSEATNYPFFSGMCAARGCCDASF